MTKKRCPISLFVIILTLILLLSGCGAEKVINGEDGRDGLSAYEIYCKNYIYIQSEKQWIDDLVAGKLENVDNSVLEEKLLWDDKFEDDYIDGEIILITDKYFSDKTFTVEDFHMIEAEKVELIFDYSKNDEPVNKIYLITLKNAGEQNIIKAIHKLEIFAFTKIARPNYVASADV